MNFKNNIDDILDPQEISNLDFKLEIVEVRHAENINSNLKEELIDKGWSELTKSWDEIKQPFFNSELFYFEGFSQSKTNLAIKVSKSTSYKKTVGLRYWRESLENRSKLSKIELQATKTLSAIVIIKNHKEEILFRVREGGDWPKSLELPGGFVRIHELDLRQSLTNRLHDDLNIDFMHSNLKIIRFLHVKDIYECMIVFELAIDERQDKEIHKNDKFQKLIFISKNELADINNQGVNIHPKIKLPFHYPSQSVVEHVFKGIKNPL